MEGCVNSCAGRSRGRRQHKCCDGRPLRRGLWSPDEDERLKRHIKIYGACEWSRIPEMTGLERCGKSCRLRWLNYLRPDLKREPMSDSEAQLVLHLHSLLGNRWSQIASFLPGRSDNDIKNFWNSCSRDIQKQCRESPTKNNNNKNNINNIMNCASTSINNTACTAPATSIKTSLISAFMDNYVDLQSNSDSELTISSSDHNNINTDADEAVLYADLSLIADFDSRPACAQYQYNWPSPSLVIENPFMNDLMFGNYDVAELDQCNIVNVTSHQLQHS